MTHMFMHAVICFTMFCYMVNGQELIVVNRHSKSISRGQSVNGIKLRTKHVSYRCSDYCHHAIKYNFKSCIRCHYQLSSSNLRNGKNKNKVDKLYNVLLQMKENMQGDPPIGNANIMGGTDYPLGQADWDPNAGQSVGGNEPCNRMGQSWLYSCARRKTGINGMGTVSFSASFNYLYISSSNYYLYIL